MPKIAKMPFGSFCSNVAKEAVEEMHSSAENKYIKIGWLHENKT